MMSLFYFLFSFKKLVKFQNKINTKKFVRPMRAEGQEDPQGGKRALPRVPTRLQHANGKRIALVLRFTEESRPYLDEIVASFFLEREYIKTIFV